MNDKEYSVACAECYLAENKSKAIEASAKLKLKTDRHDAEIRKLVAEHLIEKLELTSAVERANIDTAHAAARLKHAKATLERGFDQ